MKTNLLDIFKNMDGSWSGRRVGGFIFVICGLVGWFLKLDSTVATLIMGFGGTLLGITTADPHPPVSGQ